MQFEWKNKIKRRWKIGWHDMTGANFIFAFSLGSSGWVIAMMNLKGRTRVQERMKISDADLRNLKRTTQPLNHSFRLLRPRVRSTWLHNRDVWQLPAVAVEVPRSAIRKEMNVKIDSISFDVRNQLGRKGRKRRRKVSRWNHPRIGWFLLTSLLIEKGFVFFKSWWRIHEEKEEKLIKAKKNGRTFRFPLWEEDYENRREIIALFPR